MGAMVPEPPPLRRFAAWLYTGPLGHFWSTSLDIVLAWIRWGVGRLRGSKRLNSGQ